MKIMMLFFDDRQSPFGFLKTVFPVGRHIHQDFQREKSYDHRESALRLSSGFKNRANFAAKVELLRNWSSTIMLPYGFAILYGGIAAALPSDFFKK